MSEGQKVYLKKRKIEKALIFLVQVLLVVLFFFTWEFLAKKGIINTFIYSSPSRIIKTIGNLVNSGNFFKHIFQTVYEVIISFVLGGIMGFILAIILYEFKYLAKIMDPFLVLLNSMPKVALGPLIIIIAGANIKSVIVMALLINLIITLTTIYNGLISTPSNEIKLLKSFKASKMQILYKLVIPHSFNTIITSLKLNISMTLIGVIMGEFLVSKQGIGYLIIYGTQVFDLDLVMSGIFILLIISFLLYEIVFLIEKKLIKN